jgi:transcriptional regulator with XRE-family HTH domain
MAKAECKRFGKRVRSLRIAKGWTQEDLAGRAGLHPTYIGGVERGERNISLVNIHRIAAALNIAASRLLE